MPGAARRRPPPPAGCGQVRRAGRAGSERAPLHCGSSAVGAAHLHQGVPGSILRAAGDGTTSIARLLHPAGIDWVPFQRPQLPDAEHIERYMALAREAHWFSNDGPCVRLLSERLTAYVGGPVKCVPVASGTLGLMVALRAAFRSSQKAREVLVPSFTYVASVSAILWAGLTPVFVDVAADHWHLDSDALLTGLEAREGRLAAVLACSTFGCAPPRSVRGAWEAACQRAGVPLLVDSAAGFGSRDEQGARLGHQGTAEVFSFHATKPFAIGEGGAVVSTDADLAERVARQARFGLDKRRVLVDEPGINAKMSEAHGAIALAALDRFDQVLDARAQRSAEIRRGLEQEGFTFQRGCERSSWQFVPALAPSGKARAEILQAAEASRVQLRTYHEPLHAMPSLSRYTAIGNLAVTRELAGRIVSVPLANDLTGNEIGRIRAVLCADGRVPGNRASARG